MPGLARKPDALLANLGSGNRMLSFLELIVEVISDLFPGGARRRWMGLFITLAAILVLILVSAFAF